MTLAFILPFSFLVLLLFLFLLIKRSRNKLNLPPGPTNLPIIGNLHKLGLLPHRSLYTLSLTHGPLMHLRLGSVPTVIASSADTARAFLKTHDADCCSRPPLTSFRKLSYGFSDIAFAPYGEQWRELRKVCVVELFSPKKLAEFRPIREEEVDNMVERITRKDEVNLSEILLEMANNIACRTVIGRKYSSASTSIKTILAEAPELLTGFFFADYIPMLGWLDFFTGMRARLEKCFRDMDGFYQKVIDEHKEKEEITEDVVHALFKIQKKGAQVTDDHIKGVIMNMFIAGSDTSSASVEWTMTELIRHPLVMRRAQHEVRSVVGTNRKPDESDLDNLPYLKCIIKETMRLHPIGPLLIPHETIRHIKVDGYDIPPKTRLMINTFAIGRDSDIWERPEEFLPERFVDSRIDIKGHDFELLPFGAGRRICPGMASGILVVELALMNLLYFFNWKLPKGMTSAEDIDMSETPRITVRRKSPLILGAKINK